tara:strand:+ start:771 stop:995 length:225 start_codon:yes stop_codon:yes gene_type:complete
MNHTYSNECIVENVDSGKEVEAEVAHFTAEQSLTVYINTVKVNFTYNAKQNEYHGGFAGMDFVTKGPKLLGSYR